MRHKTLFTVTIAIFISGAEAAEEAVAAADSLPREERMKLFAGTATGTNARAQPATRAIESRAGKCIVDIYSRRDWNGTERSVSLLSNGVRMSKREQSYGACLYVSPTY